MAPKFGTSGVRGLVTELTDEIVAAYVNAFLATCETSDTIYVGWDLRESSPHIARVCIDTALAAGISIVNCGTLPTPALAYAAQQADAGAIMITGSHIPADRNGIKFYTTAGEISKYDEANIVSALSHTPSATAKTCTETDGAEQATQQFKERYTSVFGATTLAGLRVGVYQHSSLARDILVDILQALGATAVPIERTDTFVPVDTEAVDEAVRSKFAGWTSEHNLDALVSTDGDADRPMLTDASGNIVPGDVLGALTARFLGGNNLCTPVSSNTMIQQMAEFDSISLTRIGSPFVVAAIEDQLAEVSRAKVVGYEANGGFLLGFEYVADGKAMAPLLTRDCVLPILATLAASVEAKQSVSELVATLPVRFTAAERIAGIESMVSLQFLDTLREDAGNREGFFVVDSEEADVDSTDGLRVTFANGDIVHLRPSGNAPEFRCYAESDSQERSRTLVKDHLARVAERLA